MNYANTSHAPIDWAAVMRQHRVLPEWRPGDAPRTLILLIELWLNSSKCLRLPKQTQVNYARFCRYIRVWSVLNDHPDPTFLTEFDIHEFLSAFNGREYLKVQIRSQLKRVMHVATTLNWRGDNPVIEVSVKAPMGKVAIWKAADRDAIAEAARRIGQPGLASIIMTNWEIGQRLSDVMQFQQGVEFDGGGLRFWCQKTGEYINVPISDELADVLRAVPSGPLFLNSNTGKPFIRQELNYYFVRARALVEGARERGFKLRGLRHSCVVDCFIAGADPYMIAAITGHSYQRVHDLMAIYLPRDSRFAEQVQRMRGIVQGDRKPLEGFERFVDGVEFRRVSPVDDARLRYEQLERVRQARQIVPRLGIARF